MLEKKNRILKEANYIIETRKTIREVAEKFKVSKSTIHKDLQERLASINQNLQQEINKIMQDHISTRHQKGGESTKEKYAKKRNKNVNE